MQRSAPVSPLCSVNCMTCILELLVTNSDKTTQFHHGTCPEATPVPLSWSSADRLSWFVLLLMDFIFMAHWTFAVFITDLALLIWGSFFISREVSVFNTLKRILSVLFDVGANSWMLSPYLHLTVDILARKCKADHILPCTLRWFYGSTLKPPSHRLQAQACGSASRQMRIFPVLF